MSEPTEREWLEGLRPDDERDFHDRQPRTHCWFDFGDQHTCILEDGHSEPHEPTPDNTIYITALIDEHGE